MTMMIKSVIAVVLGLVCLSSLTEAFSIPSQHISSRTTATSVVDEVEMEVLSSPRSLTPLTSVSFRSLSLTRNGRISPTALFGKKEARAKGNERKNKTERVKKQKDDVIEVEGVVLESLPNAMFRCAIDGVPDTQEPVLATISGRIRKNFVKILVGDKVTMELSPYDLTRGRITFRYR
eukprot:CAMPEP_0202442372 /NCGR_PEP_ID=MMETSP1360-20130828/1821_1 /ASSEMBLY_ACC=CAM_ASM_000848 /TAXON_ID=515479 /ORGANISM="Licmophora paradoxa, Strain CCMP2313" /LENGTH=177 /DNA_ID=CAMNT_0049057719 /DNA_START=38 /DNA_END=571 /DNA_ORIENTATION=+